MQQRTDPLENIFIKLSYEITDNKLTFHLNSGGQKKLFDEMQKKIKLYFDTYFKNNQLVIDHKIIKSKVNIKDQHIQNLKDDYSVFKILYDSLDLK